MNIAGCRMIADFVREDRELIEGFRKIPVSNIGDSMNRLFCTDREIRPLNRHPLLGSAFTVSLPEGDNLMLHKAMDMFRPGDVLVINARGHLDRAIFGELMANYCCLRGAAGMVVDGAVRDREALAAMPIPIYARGVTPNGPYKNGPGEINVDISFGKIVVHPGDIVAGDSDGLIVIPQKEARAILKRSREIVTKEAEIMKEMNTSGTYVRKWVDEAVAGLLT